MMCASICILQHMAPRRKRQTETITMICVASWLNLAVLGHQHVIDCCASGKERQEPISLRPTIFSERSGFLPGLGGPPRQ